MQFMNSLKTGLVKVGNDVGTGRLSESTPKQTPNTNTAQTVLILREDMRTA